MLKLGSLIVHIYIFKLNVWFCYSYVCCVIIWICLYKLLRYHNVWIKCCAWVRFL